MFLSLSTSLGHRYDRCCLCLLDEVVRHKIVFLLERQLGTSSLLNDNAVVVAEHAHRAEDLNSHHTELDAESRTVYLCLVLYTPVYIYSSQSQMCMVVFY
jgi:hypothetical protein